MQRRIIMLGVLILVTTMISGCLSPQGELVKIENIACENLPMDLKTSLVESTWTQSGEGCVMCAICGCSCSVDDNLVSGNFSISITYVSCFDDEYTLKYLDKTFSCSNLTIKEIQP